MARAALALSTPPAARSSGRPRPARRAWPGRTSWTVAGSWAPRRPDDIWSRRETIRPRPVPSQRGLRVGGDRTDPRARHGRLLGHPDGAASGAGAGDRDQVVAPVTAGVVVSPMTGTRRPRCISRIANALAMKPDRPSPVTKIRCGQQRVRQVADLVPVDLRAGGGSPQSGIHRVVHVFSFSRLISAARSRRPRRWGRRLVTAEPTMSRASPSLATAGTSRQGRRPGRAARAQSPSSAAGRLSVCASFGTWAARTSRVGHRGGDRPTAFASSIRSIMRSRSRSAATDGKFQGLRRRVRARSRIRRRRRRPWKARRLASSAVFRSASTGTPPRRRQSCRDPVIRTA